MVNCFIPNCVDIGVVEITDAVQYPLKYNGRLLCKIHAEDRAYMAQNDKFNEDNPGVLIDDEV